MRKSAVASETSPHAWRKLAIRVQSMDPERNISTYVEKTLPHLLQHADKQKHLHIRGENIQGILRKSPHVETSPHTWRKLYKALSQTEIRGNISTCVEKTYVHRTYTQSSRKHLHMRGENPEFVSDNRVIVETSPHAWRKLLRR